MKRFTGLNTANLTTKVHDRGQYSGSTLCISSLSKFNGMASHFLIRSQLEYEGGQAYGDSGHVFILAYTQRNV